MTADGGMTAGPARGASMTAASPRPKLRHVVGAAGQTIVVPLKRLLRQTWFEALLRAATGA